MYKIIKRYSSRLKIANEPSLPNIVTASLPGPKSQAYLRSLSHVTSTAGMDLPLDLNNSLGNFCKDLDGNTFLDMSGQAGTLSLGYNHPEMLAFSKSPEVSKHMTTRMALAVFPPDDAEKILKDSFKGLTPDGLDYIFTSICDDCTIEVAIKLITMEFMGRFREDPANISQKDLDSSMVNSLPGTPELAILSFNGSVHGKLFGGLNTSTMEDFDISGLPSLNWPKMETPQYKYPLEQHSEFNEKEDARILKEVRRVIESWSTKIAGVILEPVQTNNGGFTFSPNFAKKLQSLLKEKEVSMIVDETQTGYYATGKRWAYEYWGLQESPDFVCTSKKVLSGAVFTTKKFLAPQPYRHFNTWFGDTPRLALLGKQNEIIASSDVGPRVRSAGDYIQKRIGQLSQQKGTKIKNVQGLGTFLSVQFEDEMSRNQFVSKMRQNGVLVSVSGTRSVNLRPSLTFGDEHAEVFMNLFEKSL
jgi:4-aminobutyrate aminotransferase/(S)-3-amino-2-methylpropionate transaminase